LKSGRTSEALKPCFEKKELTVMKTDTRTPQTLAAQLVADPAYAAASDELNRLKAERAKRIAQRDQLQSELGDVSELVARIENGDELSPDDSADRMRILKDQIQAFDVAINRAEQNRQRVLREISEEIGEPHRLEHVARVERLVDALRTAAVEGSKLREIPKMLLQNGIEADPRRFPQNHSSELIDLGHKLKHIAHELENAIR
jgi:seryl-tRNA synthetase